MTLGNKRTLAARLLAGAGGVSGILGFTTSPTADPTGLAPFQWFASGTLLLVLAVYLLADAAVAVQKSTQT
ncbi:MAG TPA: hypothetical protein VEI50_13275 [Nitrospiraceae bacterium]|nr:hypothetical protein [Nitrospiraceae bacterium]